MIKIAPRLDPRVYILKSYCSTDENIRVIYQISIFQLVSVGISWYLPYRYQRKSRSVHFGIIFLAITPFSFKKGALAPFLRKKGHRPPF
jgi:hypothetical protein